jgi:hypothetical protein
MILRLEMGLMKHHFSEVIRGNASLLASIATSSNLITWINFANAPSAVLCTSKSRPYQQFGHTR